MSEVIEHGAGPVPTQPGPLAPPADASPRRRSPAEEARTLVAGTTQGVLASLAEDGAPWGSVVTFGARRDGAPVVLVSLMAEHTRNLLGDPRASLVVAAPPNDENPLDRGRVTLAGRMLEPAGDARERARAAHLAAVPSAELYVDFDDFRLFALKIERVRWVGGYGRMDTVSGEDYALAEPDPVEPTAAGAVAHLNADHAGALLEIAVALTGFTDATATRCTEADRYGLDLHVETPRGAARTRVGFADTVTSAGGLRAASVALVQRAREQ